MLEGQVLEGTPSAAPATPTGQADVTGGTPESQSGQATTQAQSAPAEESFTSVDPKTLPPELQTIYKSLQADYTKKTTAIADTKKKAEAYDQISRDQRFVDYWNGLDKQQKADFKDQKAEAEKRLGEKISDEEFSKAFNSKDEFLNLLERVAEEKNEKAQKQIADLQQKLSVKDARDLVDSFAAETDKEGKPLRPDFESLDEDQLITGYLLVNQPQAHNEQAYLAKLNEAYTWAKATTQKYYEKGKADALAIITKKAGSSTEMPTQAAKGAYTGPDPKKMTVREAMELAKKGIKVPQVYE